MIKMSLTIETYRESPSADDSKPVETRTVEAEGDTTDIAVSLLKVGREFLVAALAEKAPQIEALRKAFGPDLRLPTLYDLMGADDPDLPGTRAV